MMARRITLSRFLSYISLELLTYATFLIAWVLGSSWLSGDWPFRYWHDWPLNHGPWRWDFGIIPNPRRYHLSNAFVLLMAAVALSACSVVVSFKRLTVTVFALTVVALWLSFKYFYWLID